MGFLNAAGERISILNHDPAYFFHKRPPLTSHHSPPTTSSADSSREDSISSHCSDQPSPFTSPSTTPQLVRPNSSSSHGSLHPTSPMTPNYPFDPLEQKQTVTPSDPYYRPNGPYYLPQAQNGSLQQSYAMRNDMLMDETYSAYTASGPQYPYATDLITPITPQSALSMSTNTPSSAISDAASTNTSSNSTKQIKKKYPCPHGTRFACADTFTTSGHAARHGKKHTGEKNILCPTCNKAFTRKDNMKQHERTHRSNKDSTSASDSNGNQSQSDPNSKFPSHPQSAISSDSMMDMETDLDGSMVDLSGNGNARSNGRMNGSHEVSDNFQFDNNLAIDVPLAEQYRPNFDRKYTETSQDGEGESPGLDALAMVASGMS